MVLADVEAPALDKAVGGLRADGHDVVGVVTDVADYASVEALRDAALDAYGAVHVAVQQRGRRRRRRGPDVGAHAERLDAGRSASTSGVSSTASRRSCRRCSRPASPATSSTRRRATAASRRCRARRSTRSTQGAVVTLTESLYAQLARSGRSVSASVLFPGPHVLRTGLFESWRNRPRGVRQPRPAGQAPDDDRVVRAGDGGGRVSTSSTPRSRRWPAGSSTPSAPTGSGSCPPSERSDEQITARGPTRCSTRTNPTYLRRSSEADHVGPLPVISSDCHAGLPNEQYRD